MEDWKIEQLREIKTALRNAREKYVYLNGQLCTVTSVLLVQPAFIVHHPGKALEIDAVDIHGSKHEIRLYTSEWPEERRQ